jgi:hypothetical protein
MNKHIHKHGNGTITRFDIVGSFFVNLFYNELYKKANALKLQSIDKSTTDIYKSLLIAYADFTTREEFFKQAVKGIHAYVISNTNLIDITHKECVEFVVKEFVPEKLYDSLRENQKNKLFHDIMTSTIKQFISKILSNYIKLIVDNRVQAKSENSTILQNEFLDIICIEKDKIYAKFLNPKNSQTISLEIHKSKVNGLIKIVEERNITIDKLKDANRKSVEVIQKLQQELKKKINEIKQMELNNIKNSHVRDSYLAYSKKDVILEKENNKDTLTSPRDSITSLSSNDKQVESWTVAEAERGAEVGVNSSEMIIKKKMIPGCGEDKEGKSLLFAENDDYY